MNKNKQNRKNQKKRNQSQNYRSKNASSLTVVNQPLFGFINPRCKSTLKYSNQQTLSMNTTVGISSEYRLNGMYDPKTGTHQPYGYDTVMNIYSRFTVIRAKYHVEFTPSDDRALVGVITSSQSITAVTNSATFLLASESPYSRTKALAFQGGPPAVFTGSIAVNELMGLTPAQLLADDVFAGATGSNPTQLAYLNVFAYNPSASSPVDITVLVNIWYEAICFDPYLQNQS